MAAHEIEELICLVATLDREGLARQFNNYKANFPVDFTPEFLATQPIDRLRHIFLAICLQSKRMPDMPAAMAA